MSKLFLETECCENEDCESKAELIYTKCKKAVCQAMVCLFLS